MSSLLVESVANDGLAFPDSIWSCEGEWFVLQTKSRQEKILVDEITRLGIMGYLPLMREPRNYGGRKATVNIPLFPGYVFLRGTIEQAFTSDRTRRVARIIRVSEQDRLDAELRNIAMAIASNAPLRTYSALTKGTRVEVQSGPFRGIQGIVERHAGATRLVLEVNALGCAVSLEVDGAILEPVEAQ